MCLSPWVVMCLCRWPVLKVADGESADDMEGWLGGCQLVRGGVPACHGRIVLYFKFYIFLSYLNRFVHGFCLNLEFELYSCLVVAL